MQHRQFQFPKVARGKAPSPAPTFDERVSVEEASKRTNLPRSWFYKRADQPFAEHVGRHQTLINLRVLNAWLRSRAGTPRRSLGVSLPAKPKRRRRRS